MDKSRGPRYAASPRGGLLPLQQHFASCRVRRCRPCCQFCECASRIGSNLSNAARHTAPTSPDHNSVWAQCIRRLEEVLSESEVGTWLRPLQAIQDDDRLELLAPNKPVMDNVREQYLATISAVWGEISGSENAQISIRIGSSARAASVPQADDSAGHSPPRAHAMGTGNKLDARYTFEHFVEGKSNRIARAAAQKVSDTPGVAYNPLLIYGGTGLGKTHLMHSVGNALIASGNKKRVVYIPAERFVNDMVSAVRHNTMDAFKAFYRSADALLIDDIHFFAGKERTQEEFFHTFNSLLEGKQQIILTCDRLPAELDQLDARLQNRFLWGLSVAVDPPELETRVAILMSKAEALDADLPEDVAFYIATRIRSNVRELEGALNRLVHTAHFTGDAIDIDFTRQALRDILNVHERSVTIEAIQRTVTEYFGIRLADLSSKSRRRAIARPRQIAMALAKQLTEKSLPEIGDAFGGRDHTTVLHACRTIATKRDEEPQIRDDYNALHRTLSQ